MTFRTFIADLFNTIKWPSLNSLSQADEFWRVGNFDDIETTARKDRYVRVTAYPGLKVFPVVNIGAIVGGSIEQRDNYGGSIKIDMSAGVMTADTGVSTRARKLLRRLRAGKWYPVYGNHGLNKRTPKAMQELIDAKLVSQAGRPTLFVACYVPIGYIPAEQEIFPQDLTEPK